MSATNVLGNAYESNPSDTAMVNTYEVPGNAPEITDIEDQAVDEDNTLTLTLSATDADDDEIIFFAHPLNSDDPVACSVDGDQLTLTPAPDHFGEFSIEVIAFDDTDYYESNTLTDTTIFTLTVTSINDAPVVLNPLVDLERVEGAEPDTIDISGVFLDVDESVMDADELTLTVTADEGLEADITGDTLIIEFTESQTSGLLTVVVGATDLSGSTAFDSLLVYFTGYNEPPSFEWTPITDVVADSLYSEIITASDVDIEDALTFATPILPGWLSFQGIGENTALLEGTPVSDDVGVHDVQITVSDGQESDTVSFMITVHPPEYQNVPPVWTSVPITETNEDTLYLYIMEASDENDDELTFSVLELPAWLSFNGVDSLSGTPLQADVGDHEIILNVSDGFEFVEQTFTLSVFNVNDLPVVDIPESFTFPEDSSLVENFSEYLSDEDGDSLILTVSGNVNVNIDINELTISFSASPDWNGTENLIFSVDDGNEEIVAVLVSVFVTPVNDSPILELPSEITFNEDETLEVEFTEYVNDADGDELSLSVVGNENTNILIDGLSVMFSADQDWYGTEVVTFSVTDSQGSEASDNVSVVVLPVNDAPVAMDDEYETQEEEPLVVDVPGILANDEDVDDSTFTIVLIGSVSNGVLELDDDGSFTYTPDNGYSGTDQFYYRINDGELSSDIATVIIVVTPVDDAPVAEDYNIITDEDVSTTITLVGTDEDTPDEDLVIEIVDSTSNGSLELQGRIFATYVYAPDQDYFGADTFTYRVFDTVSLQSDTGTVTITINPVNDAPVAMDDEYETQEEELLVVDVPGILVNDCLLYTSDAADE